MPNRIRESAICREIETCLAHHRFMVIPKSTRSASTVHSSIWSQCNPTQYIGVVWRNNTGAVRMGRRFVSFGVPGRADYEGFLFGAGTMISIEVKREKGRMNPDQIARHNTMHLYGCHSVVVNSYQQCQEWIESLNMIPKRKS